MGKHSARGQGDKGASRKSGKIFTSKGSRRKYRSSSELNRMRPATGERVGPTGSRKRGALEQAPARLKAERERRHHRARRVFAVAGVVLLATMILAVVGVFAYAKYIEGQMQKPMYSREKLKLKKVEPQKPFTILLLGGDDKPGTPKHRTDTMILAKVDPISKQVWMLSIPRDTRVNIPGYGHEKINAAYWHGGPQLAIRTVAEFTGVEINHYMEVDFYSFKAAVDAMGGVWVDVPKEIDDPKAAGASYKRQAAHIDAGYQLLDGDHALVFVRSRKYVDADFGRMRNQQLFFKALADQVAARQNLAKLPKVVMAVHPHIGTDMSLMEMIRTAQALKSAGSKNLYTATLTGEWKSPFVWTDEENMRQMIERMQAGRSFDDTSTVTAEDTGGSSVSDIRSLQISVDVRNGAGISGCAKQAASILKARAFNVAEVGNANQFVYDNTMVVYKDDASAAQRVADVLPPGAKVVESRGMYSFKSDILVVIGKDWDLAKVPVAPIRNE